MNCPGHGHNEDYFHANPADCPETIKEEPSYMMFARANVRDHLQTTPAVVQALLARIDRLEGKKS